MKKLIGLLIACMLISMLSVGALANENSKNSIERKVEGFINEISKHEGFQIWDGEKLGKRIELYNSEGNLSAYLFHVKHSEDIVGYLLVNPNSEEIIEFAASQSPYDDYLSEYIKAKGDKFKNKDIKMLYDGPTMYGIAVKGKNDENAKEEIIDFTMDSEVRVSVDAASAARKLMEVKEISAGYSNKEFEDVIPMATIVEKNLNVPDIQWYRACGPTTGANIVYYWDGNGYPNLVNQATQDEEDVIDRLYELMDCEGMVTQPIGFWYGLQDYMDIPYNGVFDVSRSMSVSYTKIKNEINADRPGALLYLFHPEYGNHYVTFTGYRYNIDYPDQEYYIIHDTWSNTPVNVYRKYSEDNQYIFYIFTIVD
ncbi:MAG: hypothetical protein HPY66_0506 [Firmicutes bacterium]|nr:hypothetical protein [Bacillota bacterium]MDI6704937.1 hypothetical protein [Bacillota bacterium]